MKKVLFLVVILFFLMSCEKEEKIISGAILGIVYTHNQDLSVSEDQSGISVSLLQGPELIQTTVTDSRGQYVFKEVPYGRYKVSVSKGKFIQTRSSHTLYHIGGFSPTSANYHLHEIPTFEYHIDSLKVDNKNWVMILYLTLSGDTLPPPGLIYRYTFRAFLSSTPDVSKDHYVCQGKGYLYTATVESLVRISVISQLNTSDINNNFDQLKPGRIYCVIYPCAQGQGYMIEDYFPAALGKSSNVFSFLWDDL